MADVASQKPWEMDWSKGSPSGAPAAAPTPSSSAKPWEMNWSGGNKSAAPVADDQNMGRTEKVVRGALETVAPVIAPIGRFVDRFTGAPVRAGIGAIQRGENPVAAAVGQFGEDPENAPTGKEIAQKAGVGETTLSDKLPSLYDKNGSSWKLRKGGMLDPTASGAAGLGVDVAADPLNLVGVGEVADAAKAVARGAADVAKPLAKGAAAAADFATGTKAATKTLDGAASLGRTTGKVATAAKDSITDIFKPSLAADSKEMAQTADKFGISRDLMSPSHEFGDTSVVSRLQRSVAEGSLGQKYLDAHNAGLEATTGALEKHFADNFGVPPASNAETGQLISDAIDKHVSDTFDNATLNYRNVGKKLGTINLDEGGLEALRSKAVGMKNKAIELERTSASATDKAQAANLKEWSDLILQKAEGKGSYKDLADTITNVGKAAFEKAPLGQIPADTKKLREIYNTGSEALIQSVRNHSAATADELVVNNAEIAALHDTKDTLGNVLNSAKNPEQFYNSLVKNGGSAQIAKLREILTPEQFNAVRSRYLGDLVKYHAGDDVVKFGETLRGLQKPQVAEKLSYFFKPEELKDTGELLKFGERYGNPVLSSSGTGGSLSFRNVKDKVLNSVVDEQTLDTLKSRGRANGVAPAAAPAGTAGGATAPAASEGRQILRDRGPTGNRMKAAQAVAPSGYARKALPGASTAGEPAPGDKAAPPASKSDKWANDGLEKLKGASRNPASLDSLKEKLMSDPAARELLMQASAFSPGSKGLAAILEKLRSKYAVTP